MHEDPGRFNSCHRLIGRVKSLVTRLDTTLLQGSLKRSTIGVRRSRLFVSANEKRTVRILARDATRQYWIGNRTEGVLRRLCGQYGSDKGTPTPEAEYFPWRSHSYTELYEMLFAHCKTEVQHVFECGIGTTNPKFASNMGPCGTPGASLRVWRDYFVNATIWGADIDASVLFDERRIHTFQMDQTQPTSIASVMDELGDIRFDLFVDDGLHSYSAGRCLLENAWHMVKPGGIYVIEDVKHADLLRFHSYFEATAFLVTFVILYQETDIHSQDNNLIVIRKPTEPIDFAEDIQPTPLSSSTDQPAPSHD